MKAEILKYIAKLEREKLDYPNCTGSQAEIEKDIRQAKERLAAAQ